MWYIIVLLIGMALGALMFAGVMTSRICGDLTMTTPMNLHFTKIPKKRWKFILLQINHRS